MQDEEKALALSSRVLIELPIGEEDVLQGNGSGSIAPGVTVLKFCGNIQFSATGGLILPFDSDDESTMLYDSFHVSYHGHENFVPLIELKHFRTLDSGSGPKQFNKQAGGTVPALVTFEGGDLINLGAAGSEQDADIVTAAVGLKVKARENIHTGIAYEVPLSDGSSTLMDSRLTLDVVFLF